LPPEWKNSFFCAILRSKDIQEGNHMKFITPLIGIAALSFLTSVLAQDEEATPASADTPSTTIQETPAPTPEAKAASSPPKEPDAQKKEEPATTPAPVKATPSARGKKMTVGAMLKDNETRWSAAIAKHDTATIESMVAPDYIGVNASGKVQNRRTLLADSKSDKDIYTSTKAEKLDVHVYGAGVAVVVGMANVKGTGKDGKAFDRTYRFTDTWMDRGGNWQCIASHSTLVGQR
jgi:ketosteroid isomerase-like protein